MLRIGIGFDNHRLEAGRPLWIGGVQIPSDVGAVAHSDGDVLLHALTDALLGAVGAGDIGEHFPDSDPRWAGEPSSTFLVEAARRVQAAGYSLVNLDATVFLEHVRLAEHKERIRDRLRQILAPIADLPAGAVSVKAKTMERCDAVGEGRAVAAQVAVLLLRQGASA